MSPPILYVGGAGGIMFSSCPFVCACVYVGACLGICSVAGILQPACRRLLVDASVSCVWTRKLTISKFLNNYEYVNF